MNNLGDSVVWFLPEDLYEENLCFFTRIVGSVGDTDWTTLSEFNRNSSYHQNYTMYSVETAGVDRLVISIKLLTGRFVPDNFALITEVNGEEYAIAKIVCPEYELDVSYNRIFNIEIPHKEESGKYVYPKFYTTRRRASSSPIGGELVSVGEHTHSVVYADGTRESYPGLNISSSNYIRSAYDHTINSDGLEDSPSYVYHEKGVLQSTHSDMTGQLTTSNTFLGGGRDRTRTTSFTTVLANVLETLIMANNRIQLLGQKLEEITTQGSISSSDINFLTVTTPEATDDRSLYSFNWESLKGWIVQNFVNTTVGATLSIGSPVALVDTTADCSVQFENPYSIVMVFNTSTYENMTEYNEKYCTITGVSPSGSMGSSLSLPPQGSGVVFQGSESETPLAYLMGGGDLGGILGGAFFFDVIKIGSESAYMELSCDSSNQRLNVTYNGSSSQGGIFVPTGFYSE